MITAIKHVERPILGERAVIMLPLNVVMVGRIRGHLDAPKLQDLLAQLTKRHPLLSVKVQIDDDGRGSYVSEGVSVPAISLIPRHNDDQWLTQVKEELQTAFPMDIGPLVRCTVLQSKDVSEIILCGHHAVCDGMSLGYLLRDLLDELAGEGHETETEVFPPLIDCTTVPNPPRANAIQKFIMGLINRKWASQNIRFSESDRLNMHAEYWRRNSHMEVMAWELCPKTTGRIVESCRKEGVTVNSALWTAFLAAQYTVQTDRLSYRRRSGMAVSTRDKLDVPVGDAFGFYASSLSAKLPYSSKKSFWDNARSVHSVISRKLASTNLFRMLTSNLMHQTLLDSLYFVKYGQLDEKFPRKILRKMNWHKVTYGQALTNVGRFDIPTQYGDLKLESLYGPFFYSDVEEKMIGVITVDGKLSFALVCNTSVVSDPARIRDEAIAVLKEATGAERPGAS